VDITEFFQDGDTRHVINISGNNQAVKEQADSIP
jgi:hypothetical protein